MRLKNLLLLWVALLAACHGEGVKLNQTLPAQAQNLNPQSPPGESPGADRVVVQLNTLTDDGATFLLKNQTDRRIFSFYYPAEAGRPTFMVYTIKRWVKKSNEFVTADPQLHAIPGAAPVEPSAGILFRTPVLPPDGQYKVCVSYWDDPELFSILERYPHELSGDELEKVGRARKEVCSEVLEKGKNPVAN